MKDISYYYSLPDSMSEGELYIEFFEFVKSCKSVRLDKIGVVDILFELSDRQWHTYTVLNDSLKKALEDILISCWDGGNLEFVEGGIAVTARLGLVGFFDFLCAQAVEGLSFEVAGEIRGAIAEFGGSVADPYSGMR
ncbi:hypothetical protein [Pseudomonas sp. SDO52101_S400]